MDPRVLRPVLEQLRRPAVARLQPAVGEHHAPDEVRVDGNPRRGLRIDGELEHLEDDSVDAGARLVQRALRENACPHQSLLVRQERVRFLPLLDFVLGPVARGVRGRMSAVAVRDRVEQHRPLALRQNLDLPSEGVDDGERVVAVHALGMYLLGVQAGPDPGDETAAHGLAHGLPPHPVLVVQAVEEDWQASAQLRIPKRPVLVHRREDHPLPDRAAPERRIPDVAHDDAGLAVHPLEEGGPGSDRTRAAHDGIVGVAAKGREEGVHRAAHAAVEAGLLGEQLAERAEDQELDGQVLDRAAVVLLQRPENRPVAVRPHDVEERPLVDLADRGEPLRQDLAVAPVRAVDVIVRRQQKGHPHGGGFLPDRQVGRSEMIVGNAAIDPLRLDLVQDDLELADGGHVLPDGQEVPRREDRPLLRDRPGVGVDRNVGEPDAVFRQQSVGCEHNGLWHGMGDQKRAII